MHALKMLMACEIITAKRRGQFTDVDTISLKGLVGSPGFRAGSWLVDATMHLHLAYNCQLRAWRSDQDLITHGRGLF